MASAMTPATAPTPIPMVVVNGRAAGSGVDVAPEGESVVVNVVSRGRAGVLILTTFVGVGVASVTVTLAIGVADVSSIFQPSTAMAPTKPGWVRVDVTIVQLEVSGADVDA